MTTAKLKLTVRTPAENVSVIDIDGEITAFSEKELKEAHEEAGTDVSAVILNFTGLEYMNSGGIGLLVTTLIRAQRAGHDLRAYGLSDHYRQIFELTRLDEAIHIYDNEESAIRG